MIRKRTFLILVAMLLSLTITAHADASSYKSIYKRYLKNCYSTWDDTAYFLIKNIDGKGVPELLVIEPPMLSESFRGKHYLKVYTVKNNKLKYCGCVSQGVKKKVTYSSKYKCLYSVGTGSGYESYHLNKLSNSKLKTKIWCDWTCSTKEYLREWGLKPYYIASTGNYYGYRVNAKNVTPTKWNQTYKKYFQKNMKNYTMKKLTLSNINKIK